MIPKRFIQVWLGGQIPEDYAVFLQKNMEMHSDWEFEMIDCPEAHPWLNTGRIQNMLARCRSYSEMSDVIRFAAIYEMGGIYLDTDVEVLRPLDDRFLCHDAWAGLWHSDWPGVERSVPLPTVFGGMAGSRIAYRCLDLLEARLQHDSIPEPVRCGSVLDIAWHEGRCPLYLFPQMYFYPENGDGTKVPGHEGAFMRHHWTGSWRTE